MNVGIGDLVAGALLLALLAVLVRHLRHRRRRSHVDAALKDALRPERRAWRLPVRQDRRLGTLAEIAPPRAFAVQRADLRERLSLADAEARERVHDPLQAVPNLPFGHLNTAWKALCRDWRDGVADAVGDADTGDELWSFSTLWEDDRGWREQRGGYVIVRCGQPGRFILTTCKAMDDASAQRAPRLQ